MQPNLTNILLSLLVHRLADTDDDVRSVSASCLLPVADYLVASLPDELYRVLDVLWTALAEGGDELGSSTGLIMTLLGSSSSSASPVNDNPLTALVRSLVGKLLSYPECIHHMTSGPLKLVDLVPRLYPFFRHTITSVRLAVPSALQVFLTTPSIQTADWLDERLFRFLFQNLIVEERADIREASLKTWMAAVNKIAITPTTSPSTTSLDAALAPYLPQWLQITMSPPGVPLDASLFLKAEVSFNGKVGKTGRTADAHAVAYNVDKNMLAQDMSLVSVDDVIKGRLAAAKAFSTLIVHGASVCP